MRKSGGRKISSNVAGRLMAAAVFVFASTGAHSFAPGPQQDNQNKNFDVRSNVGDLHLGNDADAKKVGLPLYPGAQLKPDHDGDSNKVNLGAFTEAFGIKLVVVKYQSDDNNARVIDFYRDKLKKYGKVIECHTHEHGGDIDSHDDDDHRSKEVKCNEDNSGPVTELKVGREDNQHVVAIEPGDSGKGSTFALIYLRTRGKQGDI